MTTLVYAAPLHTAPAHLPVILGNMENRLLEEHLARLRRSWRNENYQQSRAANEVSPGVNRQWLLTSGRHLDVDTTQSSRHYHANLHPFSMRCATPQHHHSVADPCIGARVTHAPPRVDGAPGPLRSQYHTMLDHTPKAYGSLGHGKRSPQKTSAPRAKKAVTSPCMTDRHSNLYDSPICI